MSFLKTLAVGATALWLGAATLSAAEKGMMHCFAFTVIDSASDADWQAFKAATDAMPKKMKSVRKVWHGKLLQPLAVFRGDADTRKKFTPNVNEAEGKFQRLMRQHGVCMEFKESGPAVLKAYAADPYHAEWMKAYEKVRVAGTTTYDIVVE